MHYGKNVSQSAYDQSRRHDSEVMLRCRPATSTLINSVLALVLLGFPPAPAFARCEKTIQIHLLTRDPKLAVPEEFRIRLYAMRTKGERRVIVANPAIGSLSEESNSPKFPLRKELKISVAGECPEYIWVRVEGDSKEQFEHERIWWSSRVEDWEEVKFNPVISLSVRQHWSGF